MDEKFPQLIPCSRTQEEIAEIDMTLEDITNVFQRVEEFKRLNDIKNERNDYFQGKTYRKANFICDGSFIGMINSQEKQDDSVLQKQMGQNIGDIDVEGLKENREKIINLIVADQGFYFKDNDRKYGNSRINKEFSQMQDKPQKQLTEKEIIENTLKLIVDKDERKLVRTVLEMIQIYMQKEEIKPYVWIYDLQKKHSKKGDRISEDICVDVKGIDVEKERKRPLEKLMWCKINVQDVDYLKYKELIEEIIDKVKKENPIKYKKFSKKLLNDKFYEKLIYDYLLEFSYQSLTGEEKFVKTAHRVDTQRQVKQLSILEERYQKLYDLNKLRNKIVEKQESYQFRVECKGYGWKQDQYGDSDDDYYPGTRIECIAKVIEQYFEDLNTNLIRKSIRNLLERRIEWVMDREASNDKQPLRGLKSYQPLELLTMVLYGGKAITNNTNISFDSKPEATLRVNKANLRFAEVKLLNKLHMIFELSDEEIINSWNEYLFWRGQEILSIEESDLWRTILASKGMWNHKKDNYEKLPLIGYQLYFIDCCEICLPVYIEVLSYVTGTKAHKDGNFRKFYERYQVALDEMVDSYNDKKLEKKGEEYLEIHKNAEKGNLDRREALKGILPAMEKHELFEICPDESYKLLLLEILLLELQSKKAKIRIYEAFKDIYKISIQAAATKHLE